VDKNSSHAQLMPFGLEVAMKKLVFLLLAISFIILALVMTFFYPFKRPLLEELGAARYLVEPVVILQPFFTFWMVYQAIRYERRPLPFVVIACFPFAFIWYYIERVRPRRARKTFEPYLSPEVVKELLRTPKSEIKPPETKHFQFLVILVEGSNPQDVSATLTTLVGTLSQHQANVSGISPSFLIALLGVPFPEGNSPNERRQLVDALLQDSGDRIRVAHGQCDAPYGMFGSAPRFTYGALIPGFSGILKALVEMTSGTAVEIY
jgi:hypothetical protein